MKTFKVVLYLQLEDDGDYLGSGFASCDEYVPYEADEHDATAYVHEAVSCWGGQRHPWDPFFSTNLTAVVDSVKLLKRNPNLDQPDED